MELFAKAYGLLITMTTITSTFFAPQRQCETHATDRKTAWRPLLVSTCIHGVGIVAVVVVSQLSINDQNMRVKKQAPGAEIKARLYFPPAPKAKPSTPALSTRPTEVDTQEKAVAPLPVEQPITTPEAQMKADVASVDDPVRSHPKTETKRSDDIQNTEPKPMQNNGQQPPAVSTDANRRAGSLNLSVKSATENYLDKYHNNSVAQDAKQAAADYQQRKNSPTLSGPSTQQIIANENKRPSKQVNCSSTTNKTLAFLSGLAGGTLECTKMDDHKRFVDARVQKRPLDENPN